MEAIEINDDDDATLRIMMTIMMKMLKIINNDGSNSYGYDNHDNHAQYIVRT